MFNTEIEVSLKYEQYGWLELVKGKERMSMLNNYQKGYFLDLNSLATALNVSINKLLEVLSYHSAIRGHFAHYRSGGRIIKVMDIDSLDLMIRHLASCGYDLELLKVTKEQIKKALTQFKKEV